MPWGGSRKAEVCTRKRMTFVNTTAIAYRQNHEAPADFLAVCNSSMDTFSLVAFSS